VSRPDREKWHAEISAKFPYHVDVVPPPMGYSRSEEEQIGEFLASRIGTFDLFGAIADGAPFVRYCFLHAADAQAFRERFDRFFRAQTPCLRTGISEAGYTIIDKANTPDEEVVCEGGLNTVDDAGATRALAYILQHAALA
jgi:hypothetical protein